jgi:hypothetical protein
MPTKHGRWLDARLDALLGYRLPQQLVALLYKNGGRHDRPRAAAGRRRRGGGAPRAGAAAAPAAAGRAGAPAAAAGRLLASGTAGRGEGRAEAGGREGVPPAQAAAARRRQRPVTCVPRVACVQGSAPAACAPPANRRPVRICARPLPCAVLVAWRSRRATLIRFLAPMMFLLLALVMQVALDASLSAEGRYRPIRTGVRLPVKSIPDCNQDLYIHNRPCATLVFSPNTSVVLVRRGGGGGRAGGRSRGSTRGSGRSSGSRVDGGGSSTSSSGARGQPCAPQPPRRRPAVASLGTRPTHTPSLPRPRPQDIIERIRINNDPPIPTEKIFGFSTRAEAEAFVSENVNFVMGAVHFVEGPGARLDYVLQGSSRVRARAAAQSGQRASEGVAAGCVSAVVRAAPSTNGPAQPPPSRLPPAPPAAPNPQPKSFKSYVQDPQIFWQMPVMSAVSRELARQQLLDSGRAHIADTLEWDPTLVRYPHPEMTTLSFTGRVIAPCIFAACMFGAVTQVRAAARGGGWRRQESIDSRGGRPRVCRRAQRGRLHPRAPEPSCLRPCRAPSLRPRWPSWCRRRTPACARRCARWG